jgi:alkylation response protein AidB-like acyl-CoA dehydrogenase
MRIALTDDQQRLRDELREYYAALLTPEVRAGLDAGHGIGETRREIIRQMGADGWLGVGWPKEYGGRGMTPVEQFIFYDESMRAGAPVPMLTLNTVGPTIMRFGTDAQKDYFLPRLLRGELDFCIGYSESGAGTDLASLSTKASRDGDEYVVNGEKLWTSLALEADWCWMAVRTDPTAARHRGLSVLLVDMKSSPGITVRPLQLLLEHNVNQVFFDDVRVPVTNLVGEEHEGWKLITNQLNHERVTLVSSGQLQRHIDDVRRWGQTTPAPGGGVVADDQHFRSTLARAQARTEALRLMNWEVASAATDGTLAPQDASAMKVFGSELNIEVLSALRELVGPYANLAEGAPGAILPTLDHALRGLMILTFGGGTNELQRDLVSTFGLGFPRSR